MRQPVFVVGSGRSGTHFLGKVAGAPSTSTLRLEVADTFNPITDYATDPTRPEHAYQQFVYGIDRAVKTATGQLVEKSHTALWATERLLSQFPKSCFIATVRCPLQVVASMLQHAGVLSWYTRLDTTRPNPFLGITDREVDTFRTLPMHLKCARRWLSHYLETRRLAQRHPTQFRVWNFNSLVCHTPIRQSEVLTFIGAPPTPCRLTGDVAVLQKYQELTTAQRTEICAYLYTIVPPHEIDDLRWTPRNPTDNLT